MKLVGFLLALEDYMLPCLTKKLLDFDCPGCGLQRSVIFLVNGDFLAAFKMYPAIYSIILLFGFLLVNNFMAVKHANKVIVTLMIFSVTLILGNFIFKLIYH